MKLPKPRNELIDDIAFSLADKPIPVRMIEWRHREWLETQDDNTLLRCYVATAEFRLNPNKSKDFLDKAISPAERKARMLEFVIGLSGDEARRLALDLLEKLWMAGELLESAEESGKVNWEMAMSLAEVAKVIDERRRNEPKQRGHKGGAKAAAITREVRDRAVLMAKERQPQNGWESAPRAADEIISDLRLFARERGRNPSVRKVAEWLREAGIKRK